MGKFNFWQRLFPTPVDFYGMLLCHAEKVHEGVVTFDRYLRLGDPEDARRVRRIEKEADELRRTLRRAVLRAFSTPIDREDLFYLSRRLDEVINYVKHTVRDIQVLEISPAPELLEIGSELVGGSKYLVDAIRHLPQADERCAAPARAAKNKENDIEKLYPRCLKSLYEHDDIREILKQRDLLSYMTMTADRIDEVADVILHIVVKEA